MLVAIIKNIDRTYEYLYEIQGKLISFHIDKDGFSLSNDPYINTIISKFKYNSSCEYLTDFKNYKVYYDSLTGFKHFISNGVENYEMFFKFNGIDARCYKDGQKRNIYSKLFAILGVSVILTYAGFTSLVGLKYDTNIYYATHTSHNITELTEMYKNEKLDYKDAINSINSSNLPDGVKAVISDESFLKLIFSYYENSPLEYTSSLKFNDLKLERFKEDNRQDENTKGYYDSFTPNVLYSKEGQSKDEEIPTLIHEFIHLLQAEGNSYYYLFGQFLAAGVALDAAALVHDVEEGHLAEGTQRDDAAGDGEHVPLGFQLFGAQAAEIVQHPADGMFLAEIIGEQRHTGVQQVTGFDDAVFDDFVEHVALGKALKHGHEIGGVLRLGIQLDLLLLRTLFPVFHCKLLLRAWPGPLSGSTVEWLEVCHSGPVVKVRGRGTSAAQGCLSARKMIK